MLLTENEYSDFELEFDTRVNKGSDGGVFFRVMGDSLQSANPELQIIDDDNHPEAKSSNTKLSAAAYGLFAPRYKLSKPAGEWNNYRLIVRGGHVEHWLNGITVVQYDRSFGKNKKGRIAMTIQNGTINIKNIRIRPY
jgi:hypothetical protein